MGYEFSMALMPSSVDNFDGISLKTKIAHALLEKGLCYDILPDRIDFRLRSDGAIVASLWVNVEHQEVTLVVHFGSRQERENIVIAFMNAFNGIGYPGFFEEAS